MLIVLSGLPGSGKSTLARALARETGALWLRIDTIEQTLRELPFAPASLDDAGYRVAQAVAGDNLRLGRTVIADSVNPWMLTRDAWREVGLRAGVPVAEVEIVCSDPDEHRRRVETRTADIAGLELPDWQAVVDRDYRPWTRDHAVVDTADRSVGECVAEIKTKTLRRDRVPPASFSRGEPP